jgi:hypothetical protein
MASLKKPLGLQEGNFPHYKSLDFRLLRVVVVAAMTVLVRGPTATLQATIILHLPPLLHTRPHWPA